MTESSGVNFSAAQRAEARREAKELIANQLETQESNVENLERAFNPAAADREQARRNKSKPLATRKKPTIGEVHKVKEVGKKSQEDVANRFSEKNPELPKDKLMQLRDAINEDQTAEQILEEVESFFKDPSLADEALEYLEEVTEGELQEKVKQARTLLNEAKGREIIAGRNVDAQAKEFSQTGVATPTELRDLYRDVTGTPKEHNALFIELSGRYTYDDLKGIVNFLLQGMAYDMKSKGPSIQEAELQLLMRELKNLQSILWVYLFFKSRKKLIKSLYERHELEYSDEDADFEKLAKNFIQIVEDRYPSVLKILRQAETMGYTDLEEKVIILTQYRDAVRQLSPRLYKSMKHKEDLITAFLEVLEDLYDELEHEMEMEEEKEKEQP